MFGFLYRSDYIKAKQSEDYFFFGNVGVPVPNWNFVLHSFDLSLKEELKIQKENKTQGKNKDFCLMRTLDNFGFILHIVPLDNTLGKFKDAIEFSHQGLRRTQQTFSAYIFLSLSETSRTFGMHTDTMDVWCWQIVGNTHITVLGKSEKFEKILEPGELIYIPRGMQHDTRPMGPRAILSFGLEDRYIKQKRD